MPTVEKSRALEVSAPGASQLTITNHGKNSILYGDNKDVSSTNKIGTLVSGEALSITGKKSVYLIAEATPALVDFRSRELTVATSLEEEPHVVANGVDQTEALEAAIAAAPIGGTVTIVPNAFGEPVKVKETITIEKSLTIRGTGMNVEYGTLISNEPEAFNQQVMPSTAPYLRGSVVEMTAKNKDVFHITGDGICVNIYDLGIIFKELFKETGHGIVGKYKSASGSWGAVPNNGPQGMNWSNVCVFGHDGNHYAYNLTNSQLNSFNQLQSFGGGLLTWDVSNYEGKFGNPTNSTVTELYGVLCARGTAHGVNMVESDAPGANSVVFLRPQIMGLKMNQFAALSEGPDFTKQFAYRDHGKGSDLLMFGGDVEGGEALHEFKIEGSKTGWLNVFIGGLVQAPTGTLEVNGSMEVATKVKAPNVEATSFLSTPSTGILSLSGATHWGHVEEPGLPSGTTALLTESGTPLYEVEANALGSTVQGLESGALEGNSASYITVKNIGTGPLTLAHEAGPISSNRFKFSAGVDLILSSGQSVMLWNSGTRWLDIASTTKRPAELPKIEKVENKFVKGAVGMLRTQIIAWDAKKEAETKVKHELQTTQILSVKAYKWTEAVNTDLTLQAEVKITSFSIVSKEEIKIKWEAEPAKEEEIGIVIQGL